MPGRDNRMKHRRLLLLALVVVSLLAGSVAGAQTLEDRVQTLEKRVDGLASTGLVLFLYGVFCALWAQRTKRSAWGWFFFGLFLAPIATAVLLHKNARDNELSGPRP